MRRKRDRDPVTSGDGERCEDGENVYVLCRQGEDEESSCED